jgi:uncharacterized protein (TIGR02996 family)
MTTADAFRRAIWQERDNDALRIALADWLEDHGGEEYGEFIRIQCAIAITTCRYCRPDLPCQPAGRLECAFAALRARERELWHANACDWLPAVGEPQQFLINCKGADARTFGSGAPTIHWTFRRGFVYMVECHWNDWARWHPAVLDAVPLERVVLTTEPAIGTLLSTKWPRITFDLSQLRQPG